MVDPEVTKKVNIIAASEWSKVVSILLQELRSLTLAEEATQEAFAAAIDQWPHSGVPQRPGAWLLTVARRKAIDFIRRESTGKDKTDILTQLEQRLHPAEVTIELSLVRDEQLQLLFSCCHPALSIETQLALTLRCVLGIPTEDIAKAFLVKTETIAQRLVRGKRKIKKSLIPLRMPRDAELIDRLSTVHTAIYLLYNQQYLELKEHSADALPDLKNALPDLKEEAIRLTRLLASLMPNDPETYGLLSLLLFLHARKNAQFRGDTLVLLADQDRTLWDWETVEEAQTLLASAIKQQTFGQYQIQAAINDLHSVKTYDQTDWQQIELLYAKLIQHADTPVTRLNHAVAVAESRGVDQGLFLLEELRQPLHSYQYFHATEGELLLRKEDYKKAEDCFNIALKFTTKKSEQTFLQTQLKRCYEGK